MGRRRGHVDAGGAAAVADAGPGRTGLLGLRRAASRWGSREQMHAAEEQARSARAGGSPCALLGDRHRVTVCGTLRSVTLQPRAGTPALTAEVFDGSGSLSVVWLGRRGIAGVEAGRRIRVDGLVSVVDHHAVMYNPRYELVPAGAAEHP